MSSRVWDRPANEHSRQLPSGMTLLELALAERESGRKWTEISKQLGYANPDYVSKMVQPIRPKAPRRDDVAEEVEAFIERRPMEDWERQRVAEAYGFDSWADYMAVKAAGQFRERAADAASQQPQQQEVRDNGNVQTHR